MINVDVAKHHDYFKVKDFISIRLIYLLHFNNSWIHVQQDWWELDDDTNTDCVHESHHLCNYVEADEQRLNFHAVNLLSTFLWSVDDDHENHSSDEVVERRVLSHESICSRECIKNSSRREMKILIDEKSEVDSSTLIDHRVLD